MQKVESPYQDSEQDDAFQTFFKCERWNDVGLLTSDNIVEILLSRSDLWYEFIERVTKKSWNS